MATGANDPSLLDSEAVPQRDMTTESSTTFDRLEEQRNKCEERLTEMTVQNKLVINIMKAEITAPMERIIQMIGSNQTNFTNESCKSSVPIQAQETEHVVTVKEQNCEIRTSKVLTKKTTEYHLPMVPSLINKPILVLQLLIPLMEANIEDSEKCLIANRWMTDKVCSNEFHDDDDKESFLSLVKNLNFAYCDASLSRRTDLEIIFNRSIPFQSDNISDWIEFKALLVLRNSPKNGDHTQYERLNRYVNRLPPYI
ncbi:DgyrCDS6787 [Dimorphilus gyrociliatus]|uniref:DgyrCDS6787 n=1 Tax=Dimorphilus gyrociliatus TaxID=2664684 RepID=A0A7I8VRC1_9ANNE|nr:DgyrCDS6787 [Dimorphilus gyrociliatus]